MWSQRQTSLAFEDSEETSSNMVDSQEKKISNGDLSALRETVSFTMQEIALMYQT